jgi:HK97 gp10 family phage protein
MAKWKFEGLDKYIEYLRKLDADADEMIRKAVYNGAGVVADSVRSSINGIRTDDSKGKEMRSGPTSQQKAGLQKGFGISRMNNEDGYINVKLGFSGRNGRKSKKRAQAEANITAARNIESGTPYMAKQPFMRKAVNSAKKQCEQVMEDTIEEEIKKITP